MCPRLFLYPETFWGTFKGASFFFEFSRLKDQNFYGKIVLFLFPFLVFEFDILTVCPSRWLLDWLERCPSRDQLHESIQVTWHFFLYSRTVMDELNLCDPDWLHAQLDCPQPRILLLDCRSHVEYSQKGHVTSAINIQLPALMLKRLTKGSLSVPAVIKCQQARVSEASFPQPFIFPRSIIFVLSAFSNLDRVFFSLLKFSRTFSWLTGKPTGSASTMRYDFHHIRTDLSSLCFFLRVFVFQIFFSPIFFKGKGKLIKKFVSFVRRRLIRLTLATVLWRCSAWSSKMRDAEYFFWQVIVFRIILP